MLSKKNCPFNFLPLIVLASVAILFFMSYAKNQPLEFGGKMNSIIILERGESGELACAYTFQIVWCWLAPTHFHAPPTYQKDFPLWFLSIFSNHVPLDTNISTRKLGPLLAGVFQPMRRSRPWTNQWGEDKVPRQMTAKAKNEKKNEKKKKIYFMIFSCSFVIFKLPCIERQR